MIHEMSEVTMVPLLAIPADDFGVLAGTAARRSGSTPVSRSKLCKEKLCQIQSVLLILIRWAVTWRTVAVVEGLQEVEAFGCSRS